MILTQPITALAFVWDGVLYSVSGFGYAARAMVVCAVPAVGCMAIAMLAPGKATFQMNCIWSGLALIMTMRTLTIYLPYKMRLKPFDKLYGKSDPPKGVKAN